MLGIVLVSDCWVLAASCWLLLLLLLELRMRLAISSCLTIPLRPQAGNIWEEWDMGWAGEGQSVPGTDLCLSSTP